MSEQKQPEAELLIEYRLSQLERAVTKLVEQNAQMIALEQRHLAVEQRHLETREALDRAFKAIKDTDTRVRTIETEMPTLRLVRGWVIAGMLAVIAASGTVVTDTLRKTGQAPVTQPARTG